MPSQPACATPAEAGPAPRTAPAARRGLWAAIVIGVVLLIAASGLLLYAFMLNVDLGDLKRRLSKEIEARQLAERYLVETRNQLTESLREIEQLKSQLSYREAEAQTMAAAKPALPLVVSFRSSVLGKGMVAVIDNTSERYLTVTLAARNPTRSTAERFTLEIGPRAKAEFGHLEGWQFASGDEIALFHDAYAPLRLPVP
ncbi:MAG: hypothetical protein ACLGG6_00255 [Gammaproteobacteria bacterium]